jgi:RHS repeat-associated protein
MDGQAREGNGRDERERTSQYAATLGFYEYRARAYHPGLGRFTSEDPKLFDAGDYNLYRYCHNDPLDMTDPMGLGVDWQVPPSNLVALNLQTAMKQLQRQLADLTERAQSTSEMEHSFLGRARLQQGWQNYRQGLTLAQTLRATTAPVVRTITREGYLRIDTDGSGPSHGDPSHANETAYQPKGRSLNADRDPYVAIPTALLKEGVRLGDHALLTVNGRSAPGVVGDTGADARLVEASLRLVHDAGVRTRDVPGTGPVPNIPGGREIWARMTLYPSGPPEP